MRTIEIDDNTAEALEARAAERGVSVAQVVADLVAASHVTMQADADELAELERRWTRGEHTIPHEDVVRWLKTWGTPAFKPWQER